MPNPPFGSESWSGSSPAEARSAVLDALRSGASAICVTGAAATGKTALCRELAAGVDDRSFSTGLFDATLGPDAVLRRLVSEFGLGHGGAIAGSAPGRDTMIAAVVRFLKSLKPLGAHALVVIDDADRVAVEVLAILATVAREAGHDGLRVVLVGRPALDARLVEPPLNEVPGPGRSWTRVGLGLDDALVPVIPPPSSYVAAAEPEPEVAAPASVSPRLLPLLVALLALLAGAGWWWTSRDAPAERPAAGPPAAGSPPAATPAPAAPAAVPDAASPAAASAPAGPPPASPTNPDGQRSASTTGTAPAAAGPTSGSGYRITVASFRTASRAQQIASALQAQQLAVTTRVDGSGIWHQVIAGPYSTIEAARETQRALERAGFPETQISVVSPALAPR